MVNTEDFAKRLEKVIDFYGLSASAFADSIGVQRSSISHILSGRNKPSLDFVMGILETYQEVELYWLLNGKGVFPKEIENKEIHTPANISSKTPPTLFDDTINKSPKAQESHTDKNSLKSFNNSSITRIVIFYKDGTFDEYKNE